MLNPAHPHHNSRKNVQALLDALVRREGAIPIRDLRDHYDGYPSSAPKQDLYTDTEFRAFVEDVGRPNLLALPGVEETDDGFRFVGIEASEIGG